MGRGEFNAEGDWLGGKTRWLRFFVADQLSQDDNAYFIVGGSIEEGFLTSFRLTWFFAG